MTTGTKSNNENNSLIGMRVRPWYLRTNECITVSVE